MAHRQEGMAGYNVQRKKKRKKEKVPQVCMSHKAVVENEREWDILQNKWIGLRTLGDHDVRQK